MICCKVVTNFNDNNGDFSKLYDTLLDKGSVLWEKSLFFYSLENNISEKTVSNIIKKCGYTKFFVDVYTQDNPPRESDFINGWLTDGLLRINTKRYEDESQEAFQKISQGLRKLNSHIDDQIAKIQEQNKREETDNGGRKKD